MTDRPQTTASLKALLAEVEPVPPFTLGTAAGVITFKNPADLDAWECDQLLTKMQADGSAVVSVEAMLSPKDLEKFKSLKLSAREVAHVIRAVSTYYQERFGTPGEDNASGT